MWGISRLAELFGDFDANSTAEPESFEQEYTCYPVSFLGRDELENGNKILLPQSALSILARMNVSWPMLFKITNTLLSRETHGGVLEFSSGEGTCFMPYWMMKNLLLQEGDVIRVQNTSLPKGTYVKLQPVTQDFLDIFDHRAVLEYTLRHFAAVTVGDNIVIKHNNRSYEIEIVECLPAPAISIIETDVQVDFAPPKDYIEQPTCLSSEPDKSEMTGPSSSKTRVTNSQTVPSYGLSNNHMTKKHLKTLEKSSEQDIKTSSISLKRLPGGVRVKCAEYEELLCTGKVPGIVGRTNFPASTVVSSPPKNINKSESSSFTLFGGYGHSLS